MTLHFLQIARAVKPSLDALQDELLGGVEPDLKQGMHCDGICRAKKGGRVNCMRILNYQIHDAHWTNMYNVWALVGCRSGVEIITTPN